MYIYIIPKIKCHKEVNYDRKQGFSYYFCLMMKGSVGSESVSLTNVSGFGRPKTHGSGTLVKTKQNTGSKSKKSIHFMA
jgi:hypothetical protein